jgi:Fe-S cluster assembly iron-binding protein IscA
MAIVFTQWAADILARTHAASARFNPDARIRLQRRGDEVEFALTDEPDPSDEVLETDGFTLLVERGLEGVVDVQEPHDRLILRPPGSTERSAPHDPRPA